MTKQPTPEGYMRDALNRLVPIELIRPIDRTRDELVREIVADALPLAGQLAAFRDRTLDTIQAFIQLSAEQFGVTVGGKEGNVDLTTYDGEYKVRRAVAKSMRFDERLQAAKALLDELLREWTADGRPEIRVLINDAFQVDTQGEISVERVLGLRRHDITEPRWVTAMAAIAESVRIVGAKEYVRIYKRTEHGKYELIAMDVSSARKQEPAA